MADMEEDVQDETNRGNQTKKLEKKIRQLEKDKKLLKT